MKRYAAISIGVAIGLISSVLFAVSSTGAQSSQEGQLKPGVDAAQQNVTMDCLAVKFKLTKVHENDGLKRVNAGQVYEGISTKLMARLGSRVVQQRLDGADLIKKASEYETALNDFRSHYQEYDVAMSSLIKSDCSTQPGIFYSKLQSVRSLRATVDGDVKQLTRLTQEYYKSFIAFSERINKEVNNS